MKVIVIAVGFIILITCLCGCNAPPGLESAEKSKYDLTDRFSVISPQTSPASREFYAHFFVSRKGSRKDSMVLTAPTAVHASLAGFAGQVKLMGLATPVFNVGDGIQLDILLKENGTTQLIYNRYFDAAHLAEDRDWIPFSVPMELKSGTDNWLEIQISGGPQGDNTADWLALQAMRIEPIR
jgi:hypothetical protein